MNWRSFTIQPEITDEWNEPATPSYYALDRKGVIRHKWIGYPGEKALDTALEKLLKDVVGK